MLHQRIVVLAGIEIDLEDELAAGGEKILDRLVRTGASAGVEAEVEAGGGTVGVAHRHAVSGSAVCAPAGRD